MSFWVSATDCHPDRAHRKTSLNSLQNWRQNAPKWSRMGSRVSLWTTVKDCSFPLLFPYTGRANFLTDVERNGTVWMCWVAERDPTCTVEFQTNILQWFSCRAVFHCWEWCIPRRSNYGHIRRKRIEEKDIWNTFFCPPSPPPPTHNKLSVILKKN